MTCGNILGRSFELLSELQPDGILCWEIPTLVYQQFLQRDYIFRFSIWKQETDVKMSACRRKQIDVL